MSELFKQIVWFLNALAQDGADVETMVRMTVVSFPRVWLICLVEGYKKGYTSMMHDAVCVAVSQVVADTTFEQNLYANLDDCFGPSDH